MLEWDWELSAKMASIFSSKMERKSPIESLEPRKTQKTTEIQMKSMKQFALD